MINTIQKVLNAHSNDNPVGIYSVCSANRSVLQAAMLQAINDKSILLVESTSNQVNQFGGYTGLNPMQFRHYVIQIAEEMKFSKECILFGGDHLGPHVWREQPSKNAMENAAILIEAYVSAGFTKVQLDTSMQCGDDFETNGTPLPAEIVAERTAMLCEVAENIFSNNSTLIDTPVYVIGTEVPIPGGAEENLSDLYPTSIEDAKLTIEITKQAFLSKGLESAWDRVIALVVQPGVEFGDSSIIEYNHNKAVGLSNFIGNYQNLIYEAHSTDYQPKKLLRQMVEDHFAILKVGPALTFAFREAIFALAEMEKQYLVGRKSISLSNIKETVESSMRDNPKHWRYHYRGNDLEIAFALQYSYSDRIRYYWPNAEVQKALNKLINNLSACPLPLNLISQYMPLQYLAIRDAIIKNSPIEMIHNKIMEVTSDYSYATHSDLLESMHIKEAIN